MSVRLVGSHDGLDRLRDRRRLLVDFRLSCHSPASGGERSGNARADGNRAKSLSLREAAQADGAQQEILVESRLARSLRK